MSFIAAFLVFLFSGPVAAQETQPRGLLDQRGPADLPMPTAERLVREALKASFVGTIEYEFQTRPAAQRLVENKVVQTPPDAPPVLQRGELHYGLRGEVRLDVELLESGVKVVCTVADDEAWMIFDRSMLIVRSTWPIDPAARSWQGQLRMQGQQALGWADLFLNGGLGGLDALEVHRVTVASDTLTAELSSLDASGKREVRRQVRWRRLDSTDRFVIDQIKFLHSADVGMFRDYEVLPSGAAIPRTIEFFSQDSDDAEPTSRWTVVRISEFEPPPLPIFERFTAPRSLAEKNRSREFGECELFGEHVFEASQETVVVWDR